MKGDFADIVIAGGGIPGALAALALAKAHPGLRLVLVDPGHGSGDGRMWPFMLTDIPKSQRWLIEPLIDGEWRKYEGRFPRFMRVVNSPVRLITRKAMDAALNEALPEGAVIGGVMIAGLDAGGVNLADGRRIHATAVIDARRGRIFPHLAGGWRVSYGQLIRFEQKHPFAHPLLMDMRVSQRDGCRFITCVPISAYTALVRDTVYSDNPDIDNAVMAKRIGEYCSIANWQVAEVLREQRANLPLVGAGDFEAFWAAGEGGVARIGGWAGLFNPFTGDEIAPAVSTALALAQLPELSGSEDSGPNISGVALARATREIASAHWDSVGFARLLTRMLFGAAGSRRRYKVFEWIYRLDQSLIERIYAGTLGWSERVRVLVGKPPVPLGRMLALAVGSSGPLAPLDAPVLDGAAAAHSAGAQRDFAAMIAGAGVAGAGTVAPNKAGLQTGPLG